MAFDLKGATADASFDWSSAFLFGADSQVSTDPSIYAASTVLTNLLANAHTWAATQTITPAANTNALAVSSFSLTGSNEQSILDLAGTWNTTGTPTAIKLNVTDTASNAASLLMDLQVGGVSKMQVFKRTTGLEWSGLGGVASTGFGTPLANRIGLYILSTERNRFSGGFLEFSGTTGPAWGSALGSMDTYLVRDNAANTLALRNSTNAQTFNIYGTYTDASNYRRVAITMTTAGVASITPTGSGTGGSGNVLHISGLPTSNPGPGILWNNAGTPAIGT